MDSVASNKALVIGNGESRKNIDIQSIKSEYTLFGCNAIHRDITVDHLICCDKRMGDEAVVNPNNSNSLIYVRPDWFHYFRKILKQKNIRLLPELPYSGNTKKDHPDHWGSGCYAVLLAAQLGFETVEILGFDLYPKDGLINNIYKGTVNYAPSNSKPIDHSYWVYQISQIFHYFPNTRFVIRNKRLWQLPDEWKKSNVTFSPINSSSN